MKLLLINTVPLWGGGEYWTLRVAREFIRRGHDVTVLAAERGELHRELSSAAVPVLSLPASLWQWFRAVSALRKTCEANSPDLLLAITGRDVRLANQIRPQNTPAPLVFSRHLDKPLSNHIFHRLSFERVQAILANSVATRETIRKSFPWYAPEQIHVVYNPFDVAEFTSWAPRDVRGELGIPREAFVLGIVGRLTQQKGHATLLQAMPEILNARPDAHLLIVGDGELRQELPRLASGLKISRACHFIGHIKTVQPYYAACDVVAIPSFFEGFCYTALEAQILGKPVVASNTSSLPEVVRNGVTGWLVPVNEPASLAKAILELAENEGLRKRMGEVGQQFVKDNFDARRSYNQLEDLLENLLAKAKP